LLLLQLLHGKLPQSIANYLRMLQDIALQAIAGPLRLLSAIALQLLQARSAIATHYNLVAKY